MSTGSDTGCAIEQQKQEARTAILYLRDSLVNLAGAMSSLEGQERREFFEWLNVAEDSFEKLFWPAGFATPMQVFYAKRRMEQEGKCLQRPIMPLMLY